MPWVWLHATKDYLEMAEHFVRCPDMKATINLVPSLLKQISEYLSGDVSDPLIEMFKKPADRYTEQDKHWILENCFHANHQTMISRSPRFLELHDIAKREKARLQIHDYRDIVVHYGLAWTGAFAREEEPIATLVQKDREYSEEDKQALLRAHYDIVAQIIPLHKMLAQSGQIELSTTPFYHPIMPLLCDTNVARESVPHIELPETRVQLPQDAHTQIERAKTYFTDTFGSAPEGFWPSEGSLSDEVLKLLIEQGIKWTATDEAVLQRSLSQSTITDQKAPEANPSFAKYLPFRYHSDNGEITIFFRDHVLSDNIGFVYQSWSPEDAVQDFLKHLKQIRQDLIAHYGAQVLDRACVSVILDGENCWEYYRNNGREFLEQLYIALSSDTEIRTCTMSEVLNEIGDKEPTLEHLSPGSWINANFNIWIGHAEDNIAWEELACASEVIRSYKQRMEKWSGAKRSEAMERYERASEELLIAQGSDWNWWYGDDHHSAHQAQFDELFRMHIRSIYAILDQTIPHRLSIPVSERARARKPNPQITAGSVTPEITGLRDNQSWSQARSLDIKAKHGAMHKAEKLRLEEIRYADHGGTVYLRSLHSTNLTGPISITMLTDGGEYEFSGSAMTFRSASSGSKEITLRFAMSEVLELALPKHMLAHGGELRFALSFTAKDLKPLRFPETGWFTIKSS